MTSDQIQRWRLILGKSADDDLSNLARCQGCLGDGGLLEGEAAAMDDALDLVYPGEAAEGLDITKDEWARDPGSKHSPVKGRSFPRVARWLGEVRRLFPKDVVVLIQKDAIERRGLKQLLFEPEILAEMEPSVDLASMILSLKNLVPENAKAAAREVVRKAVEEIRQAPGVANAASRARRPQSQSTYADPQPRQSRLAARDSPQSQKLPPGAANVHPRTHGVFQPGAAAGRMERHHCHGSIGVDGLVA